MARRMEEFLSKLIHNDQTGFIRNRQTQDNIRRTLHIINHIQKNKTEAVLISVDAEKACDSVNWEFLYKILHKFGLHNTIIDTIKALYTNPTARIKINGYLSSSFTLERGTRQGCSWSPLLFALYLERLAQSIRQNPHIKGITIGQREHKLACYADDILVYFGHPTDSLPKLMLLLEQHGRLSGYKINLNKTQTLSYNYHPSVEITTKCPIRWQGESLKYLGISIPKNLTKIFEFNYTPLKEKIDEDLKRWNLIPYFSLYSRIESIKMNVLPRLLYLFQTLPIQIDQIQFNEWDKMISRYIWEGKRPRVCFKTLQLSKEKGGWGLPSLRDYFRAAQMKASINWCDISYNAQWKSIEEQIFPFPIQATLADANIQKYIDTTDNPWVQCILSVWKNVVKEYNLKKDIVMLKWYAYDSDFLPKKLDSRFK
uniref:Reverse transcriptase domain-containing protein n=1 Tax=Amphiprion percula TaxID=161767 RepID=A0A3P8U3W0_AMPPE